MTILRRFNLRRDRQIAEKAMDACEAILRELGADLHDDLIQKLSVLRLHMDKIERSSYDPTTTQDVMLRMKADFQQIIEAVRRISRQYLPVHANGDGFENRLSILCENIDFAGSIKVELTSIGPRRPLPVPVETHLLRMVQELIHNAMRHSAAWTVWVSISWEHKHLFIEVEDDGSGFSVVDQFVQRLLRKYNTLRMRSEAIGASIGYSTGKKGLLAKITFPYSELK